MDADTPRLQDRTAVFTGASADPASGAYMLGPSRHRK
jgi:hypothetical protein